LADLHLGKSIHGVSLLDNGDQPAWTARFLELCGELRPDAVLIAGDVYDRSAPSGDAVQLLDRLLTGLAERGIPVLLVAGNHDSGQRLSFGGSLLARQRVHIAGILPEGGALERVTLEDEWGPVDFWLMPYVFPALVARALGDESIRDYDTAVRRLLAAQEIDFTRRNVLIAHQNVTHAGAEAERGGSESMIGGVGQVADDAFDGFSYVALGHIHAAGSVGRPGLRYAGSPLCYHFDETRQPPKGPLLVTLGAPGEEPSAETLRIPPLHPMRELRGSREQIWSELQADTRCGEYLRAVLTDGRVTPEIGDLFRGLAQSRDSLLLELASDFRPFPAENTELSRPGRETPVEELFAGFYAERRGGEEAPPEDLELLRFAGERLRHREASGETLQRDIEALLAFLTEQEAAR
jgi:exonuclease SbcD